MALSCCSIEVAARQSLRVIDLVAVLVPSAHGGFNATVGEETTEGNGGDPFVAKDEVQVGAGEGIKPTFALDDDVTLLRSELFDNSGPPAVFYESVAVDYPFEDPIGVLADLAVALGKADGCMHDGHASLAGRVHDPSGVGQHVGLRHDLLDRAVQDATLRGEVILVLDQDHCGRRWIDGHGSAPRLCGFEGMLLAGAPVSGATHGVRAGGAP